MDFGFACPELVLRFRKDAIGMTLGEFMDRASAFTAGFVALHQDFVGLRLMGKNAKDSPVLMEDLSNLRPWLIERAWRVEDKAMYKHLSSKGLPTLETTGGMGFDLDLLNLKDHDGKVRLHISCGESNGYGSLVLPRKDHPEFQQSGFARELLALAVQHWPVSYASFGLKQWITLLTHGEGLNPDPAKGPVEVGWLTYIEDSHLTEGLPAEFEVERFGPGRLIQLTPEMAQFTDPQDMAMGARLKAAIDARSLALGVWKPRS